MVAYFETLDGRHNAYFLRHGESEGNSAGIIQGRLDLPLSENGLKQSEQIASWFVDRGIDAVLSSPLKRAAQTAQAVSRTLGLEEVRLHDALNELDTGIFTGLTVSQVRKRHPQAWKQFQRWSWEGVPKAETMDELLSRAERLWKDLGRQFTEGKGNLLCVTHSGTLQWIIKATFGQRSWRPLVPVGNCSVCQFSLDNDVREEHPRYYFEWTRLNDRPVAVEESSGHMFLES
jgi:broad specificity phosphatase PhoE